jgi:hypothetical protein
MTREDEIEKLARRADEQKTLADRRRRFLELQDSYYLHYLIGDADLRIMFASFKLMTIPYDQIVEIDFGSLFEQQPSQIDLMNGKGTGCRIRKSRGWFRYVLISVREPKRLLSAISAFHSRVNPVKEIGDVHLPLPAFLSPDRSAE